MMKWLKRFRRPRVEFDHDPLAPATGETDSEAHEPPASLFRNSRRWPWKPILAVGLLALGLGGLWNQWGGSSQEGPAPPSLLPSSTVPESPPGVTQEPASAPEPQPTPSASPPLASARPAGVESAEPAPAGPPAEEAFAELVQVRHEATIEELRAAIADQRLKRLKAEVQARAIKENPELVLDKRKPDREASVSEPSVPTPPPARRAIPFAQKSATGGAKPEILPDAKPPMLRVRMVWLEPVPAALLETVHEAERARFTVRRGDRFPEFAVVDIDAQGVTLAVGDVRYFYPVGGTALVAQRSNRRGPAGQEDRPPTAPTFAPASSHEGQIPSLPPEARLVLPCAPDAGP
ncbi:MAG: hypothetical protein ACE5NC_02730 [Anaerolineae bacterium]